VSDQVRELIAGPLAHEYAPTKLKVTWIAMWAFGPVAGVGIYITLGRPEAFSLLYGWIVGVLAVLAMMMVIKDE